MRILYGAIAGFLFGVSAFFTFVVPEAAFGVLRGGEIASFLNAVFPRFYLFSAIGGALLLAVSFALLRRRRAEVWVPLLSLLLTLLAWLWLLPAVRRASGTPGFGALHGLSLGLDFLTMLLYLWAIYASHRAARGA